MVKQSERCLSDVRMFFPAVETGRNAKELGLSVNLFQRCVKILNLPWANDHRSHECDDFPLMSRDKPDTATSAQRAGLGKNHHRSDGSG